MKENFERTLMFILQREGATITNDPADRGGLTAKYGLTFRTMKALKMDLNGDGVVNEKDVYLVTVDVINQTFRGNFWDAVHGDDLPGGIDLIMADIAWNAGPGRANKFYREGHKTVSSLTERRKQHYLNIIERDPTQERFKNGWLNRAAAALREAQKCMGAQ